MKIKPATAFAVGTVLVIAFLLGGYLLVRGNKDEFGYVMFMLVPVLSGVVSGSVVKRAKLTATCCLCGGAFSLLFLLLLGLEGIVCLLFVVPILALFLALGAMIGIFIRHHWIDHHDSPGVQLLLILFISPLLIAAADQAERPIRHAASIEAFSSEVILKGSPDHIWHLIEKMDHLDGERPFLLRLGIPTPYKCELTSGEIGGTRTCYFNTGLITQEITDWRFPNFLGLKVTKSTLPGRHWLGFRHAYYELLPLADGYTKVIRCTEISSKLYPRCYWRPLEKWGVTSEHEFIFNNLKRWTATDPHPASP